MLLSLRGFGKNDVFPTNRGNFRIFSARCINTRGQTARKYCSSSNFLSYLCAVDPQWLRCPKIWRLGSSSSHWISRSDAWIRRNSPEYSQGIVPIFLPMYVEFRRDLQYTSVDAEIFAEEVRFKTKMGLLQLIRVAIIDDLYIWSRVVREYVLQFGRSTL